MDGEEERRPKPPIPGGCLVWAKLKNQHWWPAQVHPSSSASEEAEYSKPKESESHLLVAFFGKGTYAWCEAAQLRPFVADFDDLARQSTGKGFVAAVAAALDEIGSFLEAEMGGERSDGIKEGAFRPRGRIHDLPNVEEFFDRLRGVASDASMAVSLLELTVLRSCLVSFRRYFGRSELLAAWSEWDGIDGVEEKSVRRKKKRSMAELIAETGLDDVADEEEEEKRDYSPRKRRRKKAEKAEVVGGGENEEVQARMRKNAEKAAEMVGGREDEEVQGSGRRERKKSKYLSPPYTMVDSGNRKNSTKGSSFMRYDDEDFDTRPTALSRSTGKCGGVKGFVLDEDKGSVGELLAELRLAALDSMYLEDNEFDDVVRGFFDKRRGSLYIAGPDFQEYNGSSDGVKLKTPGLFSQEGKPGGFQIVSDLEKDGGPDTKRTPSFDINLPLEGKSSHGVVEGREGLIDVNVICPDFEANDLKDGNRVDGDEKPKKTVKRKMVGVEPNGSVEQSKPTGRPRKKSSSSGDVASNQQGKLDLTIAQAALHPVTPLGLPPDGDGLENGKLKKKKKKGARKAKKEQGNLDIPYISPCLLQPQSVNSNRPFAPSQSQTVPEPPHGFVKNSLQKMITTLNETEGNAAMGSTDDLEPAVKGQIVDEMNGLLEKVNKLITPKNPTLSDHVNDGDAGGGPST